MASSPNHTSATTSDPTPDRRSLFDIILPRLHKLDTNLVRGLLFSGNADLTAGCEAVLYADLIVLVDVPGYASEEDDGQEARERRKREPSLRNPRLGQLVRQLVFRHRLPSTRQTQGLMDESERENEREQAWSLVASLLHVCPNLSGFTWELCFGINSEIWQKLSAARSLQYLDLGHPNLFPYPNITTVAFPRISPQLEHLGSASQAFDEGAVLVGEGGWGLGPGWESLQVLKLARLSQNGAKTLATHLRMLCSRITPTITLLDISTHFLDSNMLSSIGQYGELGSLRRLILATTGTRLTADGLKQALEGCPALESFVLKDGEGRLDKNTWAQIDAWPTTLRSFEIEINESAGHHSWVLDHLASIDHVPFLQLKKFAVCRLVHPVARLPFPPVGVAVPAVQKGYEIGPIPIGLLQAIVEGEPKIDKYNPDPNVRMRILCLDWWEIGPNELDGLVKNLSALSFLQVAISFPLVKMITMMQTTFAGSADMTTMNITSAPKYNLEVAPAKSKPEYTVPDMPPYLASKLQDPDPSIPDTKDVRKFARRMPKLRSLQWTGRGGKGEWTFEKKTTLVSVFFKHSAVFTQRIWEICQLDPPFFEYKEPESTKPTLLQMPPPPASVLSSPIAELPSATRSGPSGSGAGAHRPSNNPSSPNHPRSSSFTHSRSYGSQGTPDMGDEELSPMAPVIQTPRRRGTTDGNTPSLSSASVSSSSGGMSDITDHGGRARRLSIDVVKSTKMLTIGDHGLSPTHITSRSPVPPSVVVPARLKTTSAPARTSNASSTDSKSQQTQGGGTGSGKAKYSDKSMKERKIDGPRRSK